MYFYTQLLLSLCNQFHSVNDSDGHVLYTAIVSAPGC